MILTFPKINIFQNQFFSRFRTSYHSNLISQTKNQMMGSSFSKKFIKKVNFGYKNGQSNSLKTITKLIFTGAFGPKPVRSVYQKIILLLTVNKFRTVKNQVEYFRTNCCFKGPMARPIPIFYI